MFTVFVINRDEEEKSNKDESSKDENNKDESNKDVNPRRTIKFDSEFNTYNDAFKYIVQKNTNAEYFVNIAKHLTDETCEEFAERFSTEPQYYKHRTWFIGPIPDEVMKDGFRYVT